jgi:PAS domain S-box-containing protein
LFENAPFAIILHDVKGKILNVNKEAQSLFLYQKDDFLRQNLFNLVDSKFKNAFKQLIVDLVTNNNCINKYQITVKNKIRSFIHVDVSSSFLIVADQIIIETYFLDISEKANYEKNRKFLIDQLLNSLEAKTTFFSAMSHDLRTPLNAIIGFADLLLEGAYGLLSKEQIDFLKDIKYSAIDLLNLIINVLDFTEIESGLFKLNISKFKLLPLIKDITNILKPLYKKKGITFYLGGIDEHTCIYADLLKFKQILYNLFENAIKYTDYGSFSFKGIEKTDHWEFQIEDTGIGIDKKDYDVVFREYERVEKDVRKSVPGSGIGLALTKRLVQLHNGEIWFESEPNKGTIFYFTIPKALS